MDQNYHRLSAPFPGYLFAPKSPGPHPGILLLHGSDGGRGDFWNFPGQPPFPSGEKSATAVRAQHLASMGYVAYAFSYFYAEKTSYERDLWPPDELVRVSINQTLEVLHWLKNSELVQGLPVGLYGGSRGAEHALLLASVVDEKRCTVYPDAIVTRAPPDKVFPGFTAEVAGLLSNDLSITDSIIQSLPPAWIFNEEPVETGSDIAIERITSPLLTMYGAKDELWGPSIDPENLYLRYKKFMSGGLHIKLPEEVEHDQVIEELESYWAKTEANFISTHLCFEHQGHSIPLDSSAGRLATRVVSHFFNKYLKS